jgi:hypothetical protein
MWYELPVTLKLKFSLKKISYESAKRSIRDPISLKNIEFIRKMNYLCVADVFGDLVCLEEVQDETRKKKAPL